MENKVDVRPFLSRVEQVRGDACEVLMQLPWNYAGPTALVSRPPQFPGAHETARRIARSGYIWCNPQRTGNGFFLGSKARAHTHTTHNPPPLSTRTFRPSSSLTTFAGQLSAFDLRLPTSP